MEIKDLKECISEAKRFIKRAKTAKQRIEEDKWLWKSKETAAARRASLDLTRALAELRRRRE